MNVSRGALLRRSPAITDVSHARIRARARALYPVAGAVAVSMVVGLSIVRGGSISAILIALCLGAAMVPLFLALGARALPIWLIITPVAYPFLRYPPGRALVSFDRVWILAMLLVALAAIRQRQAPASRYLHWALVWLLISYGLRAALTTSQRTNALEIWIDAIVLPIAIFVVARRWASDRPRLETILGATAIAGALISLLGIAEHFGGFELASRSGGLSRFDTVINLVRVSGPYQAPEPYALALVCCLAATLVWVQLRGRATYLLGGAAIALELVAIYFSYFRAAWIAGVIVLVAVIAIRPRRAVRSAGMVLLAGVVLYFGLGQVEQNSTVAQRLNGTVANDNVSGRFATYQEGLEVFRTAPLFGVGVDQYSPAAIERAPAVENAGVNALPQPHSSFVGLLAEQGVVGFLPLLAVMFAIYRMLHALGRRARKRDEELLFAAVGGAAIAYLVMSLTLTMLPYGPSNVLFALLLGLAAARLDSATARDEGEAASTSVDAGGASADGARAQTRARVAVA